MSGQMMVSCQCDKSTDNDDALRLKAFREEPVGKLLSPEIVEKTCWQAAVTRNC